MNINERIKTLLEVISEGIYEKEQIIALSLLSAMAGESIFLLGPPGTAKSLVARRLKLAFKDARSFEYLMSRFSTPDDIFGPVSISLLKNEDKYERAVDGFLPSATVVFLDEIWKAGPSIQNSLLTAINEKIYQNGAHTIHLPMKALIAASNELPAENEGLEALWDRFLIRMVSNNIKDNATFFEMIRQDEVPTPNVPEDLLITNDLYESLRHQRSQVKISENVCRMVEGIKLSLQQAAKPTDDNNAVNEMDYYVSDRRWKKCFQLMRTSALLNDRSEIDATDILLLIHCLWNKTEIIPTVIEAVTDGLVYPIMQKLECIDKSVDKHLAKYHKETDTSATQSLEEDELELLDFPKGQCFINKQELMETALFQEVRAVIYYNNTRGAWIIDPSADAWINAQLDSSLQLPTFVRIKRDGGRLLVDGDAYELKLQEDATITQSAESQSSAQQLSTVSLEKERQLMNDSETLCNSLKQLMENSDNMFVSARDFHVAKAKIYATERKIMECKLRLDNLSKILEL